jgi:hypothetical protein
MRGNCSFCWYWWNCCPSLLKLFVTLINILIHSLEVIVCFVDIGKINVHHCISYISIT